MRCALHPGLPLEKQKPERLSASRCQLEPERLAVWWSDDLAARLSGLAAKTLAEAKLLDMSKLEPHRALPPPDEWPTPPNVRRALPFTRTQGVRYQEADIRSNKWRRCSDIQHHHQLVSDVLSPLRPSCDNRDTRIQLLFDSPDLCESSKCGMLWRMTGASLSLQSPAQGDHQYLHGHTKRLNVGVLPPALILY
jgi:hypothetical protein